MDRLQRPIFVRSPITMPSAGAGNDAANRLHFVQFGKEGIR
jgi:hypothetical protein